jgi:predicted nucleotidyltransferase
VVSVAGIEAADLGITGSILLGLHNPSFSDIDLLVYGLENAQKVRMALKEGGSSRVQPVAGETLNGWCASVVEHFSLDYKEAYHLAKRRWNYGFFDGRYFSIHATRKEDEIRENYGDRIYREAGAAGIRAVVTDASESLFMPAVYRVEDVEVIGGEVEGQRAALLREVVSYEGLYRDVVDDGMEIEASGKLERINGEYYRLVVGTTGHRGGGYIRPALLEEG